MRENSSFIDTKEIDHDTDPIFPPINDYPTHIHATLPFLSPFPLSINSPSCNGSFSTFSTPFSLLFIQWPTLV